MQYSVFHVSDLIHLIADYLDFESLSFFRRCNKAIRRSTSGNLFYEKQTVHLQDRGFYPSAILKYSTDFNYRRYCKKRGWRAISNNWKILFAYRPNPTDGCPRKLFYATFNAPNPPRKLSYLGRRDLSRDYGILKYRDPKTTSVDWYKYQIALFMTFTTPKHLSSLLSSISKIKSRKVFEWFQEHYLTFELLEKVLKPQKEYQYDASDAFAIKEWLCDQTGLKYIRFFGVNTRYSEQASCLGLSSWSRDLPEGQIYYYDFIFALHNKILATSFPKKHIKQYLGDHALLAKFRDAGYLETEEYFIHANAIEEEDVVLKRMFSPSRR